MSLDYIPELAAGALSRSLQAASSKTSTPGNVLQVRAYVHKTVHEEDTGETDVLDVTQEGKHMTQF